MSKLKVILHCQQIDKCACFFNALNSEFNTVPTCTDEQFLSTIQTDNPSAAIICCCSAREENAHQMARLAALARPLPAFVCFRTFSIDFVRTAVQEGVNHFLSCKWDRTKIASTILESIQKGEFKEILQRDFTQTPGKSPYLRKLLAEIAASFPNRPSESEISKKLKISPRWLRRICHETLGMTYARFVRQIWIDQALHLMATTALDNTEIAIRLNWSEESSMARDFRKELGCSPKEARELLMQYTPKELLESKLDKALF